MPATRVTLPATVIAAVPAIAPVKPVQVIDWAPVFPAAIVMVGERQVQTTVPSVTVLPTVVGHVGSTAPVVPEVVHS